MVTELACPLIADQQVKIELTGQGYGWILFFPFGEPLCSQFLQGCLAPRLSSIPQGVDCHCMLLVPVMQISHQ